MPATALLIGGAYGCIGPHPLGSGCRGGDAGRAPGHPGNEQETARPTGPDVIVTEGRWWMGDRPAGVSHDTTRHGTARLATARHDTAHQGAATRACALAVARPPAFAPTACGEGIRAPDPALRARWAHGAHGCRWFRVTPESTAAVARLLRLRSLVSVAVEPELSPRAQLLQDDFTAFVAPLPPGELAHRNYPGGADTLFEVTDAGILPDAGGHGARIPRRRTGRGRTDAAGRISGLCVHQRTAVKSIGRGRNSRVRSASALNRRAISSAGSRRRSP
ncbi:hypothetical protein BX286_0283 [Streptomyces sp. 3211.6]|nr:hypothetical protein BX286_0283 [Streptomyces sp. 3211.6]